MIDVICFILVVAASIYTKLPATQIVPTEFILYGTYIHKISIEDYPSLFPELTLESRMAAENNNTGSAGLPGGAEQTIIGTKDDAERPDYDEDHEEKDDHKTSIYKNNDNRSERNERRYDTPSDEEDIPAIESTIRSYG